MIVEVPDKSYVRGTLSETSPKEIFTSEMKEPDRGWVGLGSSFIVEDMLAQEDNQYPQ